MNGRHRYNDDTDLHDLHSSPGRDREISLGTATILGIFLALALLCAIFFAFGYSLGRKSTPPPPAAPEATPVSSNVPKPSPGLPTSGKQTADTADTATDQQADLPAPATTPTTTPTTKTVALNSGAGSPSAPSIKPAWNAAALTRSAVTPIPATAATGTAIVQVAAVSHQEDADVLLVALKRRGYTVAIHHEPQDKLLHVQIGPFATKKDADAMRQRLLSDGYNAIVK
ncbi:MAG: Sporulation protein [Edaphobacter sp.]|nr:Sporulation protein [Edaphobacter sp.]MCU1319039.1 Sporulation protein [Edaphobacter sp.]